MSDNAITGPQPSNTRQSAIRRERQRANKNANGPTNLKGMMFVTYPADHELNARLIDISKALSTLVCGAATADDAAYIRNEALRTVAEQSEVARLKLSHSVSGS